VALVPTANEISVREVLAKFEAEFASVAKAVENGEFALWVGSGISRRAPNLGDLIEQAFDYIRERAINPASACAYLPALYEALGLAEIDPANVKTQYVLPLANWPEHAEIIDRLWTKYSRVLDIRIAGTDPDFILWEAIDVRQAFEKPEPPAAEHLCIAILILEGAIQAIASANWDGFIEAAVAAEQRCAGRHPSGRRSGSAPGTPRSGAVAEVPWLHRACHARTADLPTISDRKLHPDYGLAGEGRVRGDAQCGRRPCDYPEDTRAGAVDPGQQSPDAVRACQGSACLAVALRSSRASARFLRGQNSAGAARRASPLLR
jgi:hypothetical protein